MKKIIKNLKYLKITDFLDVILLFFALLCSIVFKIYNKLKKRKLWLVTEEGKNARDNGYHFYKYVRQNHPEKYCFFVIDRKEKDYLKVKQYGNIINYRSFKHWIYYLSADLNISSQKNGNPSNVIFYVLHVYLRLFNNRVFLQHGVTKDYCEWLIYKNTKFKRFICGAKDEFIYIRDNYGYPKENVIYTGLPRFDNLNKFIVNKKQILIMPSWRNWLGRDVNILGEKVEFKETMYFKFWNALLNNKKLTNYIEKNDIKVLFYPHINMQKYLYEFKCNSKNIKFLDLNFDIQKILKSSALLVTDYSSVFMDFSYMKKPIIYFQFDEDEFRKKQYQEGYFSYRKNGFGTVTSGVEDTVKSIIKCIKNNYEVENVYLKRMNKFFPICDNKNCERIYNNLNQIK